MLIKLVCNGVIHNLLPRGSGPPEPLKKAYEFKMIIEQAEPHYCN